MAAETAVTPTESAPVAKTPITETEEFKQERERMRLNFEAEYRRKQQELETKPASPASTGRDYYDEWGDRHGLPAEAARELVTGIIGHVHNELLPKALTPLSTAQKRQELRSQRTELRGSNPKLARLDDRYHSEAMTMLDGLRPEQIGADSYVKALQMVIGAHIEEIEAERVEAGNTAEAREAEPAPGPEPLPSSGSPKPTKIVLNKEQQQFCDDNGFSAEDFAEIQRDRARRLEAKGMTKPQIRTRLGAMLGTLEF